MAEKLTIPQTDLVNGLQAHSHEAFSALYDNYAPALLGIVFKILQDGDEAENLMQAFIKIWSNIGQYDHCKGRLFTWLITILQK